MYDNLLAKKNRKFLLFSTACLLLGVAVFVIGHNSQLLQHLTYGDSSYTITLNEANSPLNLAMEEYGSGEGYGRYVEFKYTLAKLQTGSHAVLGEDGTLFNSDTTRITSIKSITATFTGGQATLEFGPTKTTIGDPQVLTTATPYYFSTDPYFFVLTNTGTGSLVLASLVINYSCQDVHSTIEFVTNGGSSVAPITQAHGSVVEAPSDPTKTGYLLDGWYTEPALINEFSFTTMPVDDVVLHAKWIIDPAYPVLTLSEFKALTAPENAEHHFVRGVVSLAKSEMEIIILADATDTLIVFGYQEALVGDEVRVGGFYAAEETLVTLEPAPGNEVSVDLYSHNNEIALTPTAMSVATFNALDPDSPASWVVYAEINGPIGADDNTHQISLSDGEDTMPVVVIGEGDYSYIRDYAGFRVNIRGVILPNMDNPEEVFLMFIFNGDEDFIDLDYYGEGEDQELLTLLEGMFRGAFESPTYFPGQFVDLPADHPVVPVALTYEPYGAYASKYSTVTNRISDDVSAEIYIDIHVNATLTLNEVVDKAFDIQLHVDPDLIITIAELKLLPDSNENPLVIQCVVLNSQASGENFMLLVADGTGIIYINTDNGSIAPGDEVVAVGYKMTMETIVVLFNDPHRTVDHTVATGQSMPMTPTAITIADFIALEHAYVAADFRYYELSRTLAYLNPGNPAESLFILTSGSDSLYVYPTSPASRATLSAYVGENVIIRGIAMLGGEPGSQVVMLGFLPISGCIALE